MPDATFPNVNEAVVAPLETIDFACLEKKQPSEVKKLLDVCQTHGFFYLDLRTGGPGKQLLEDEKGVLKVMDSHFNEPLETKMKDDRNSFQHGYKPIGTFSGVTENSKDCYETLKVARAEMVEKSENLPPVVKKNVDLFDSYISLSHHVTQTILSCLSDALNLHGSGRFESHHRSGEPTNTTLVLLSYPPNTDDRNVGHNQHTDIGSVTLLFSNQWGLQVVTPGTKSWAFVQPRPGNAVINVGDSLRFLSGKRLASCLHRVVPVNEKEHRYSIAYFLRPESALQFKDPEERVVSAEEWHDKKYVMFAEPHRVQAESKMLMGGMETLIAS